MSWILKKNGNQGYLLDISKPKQPVWTPDSNKAQRFETKALAQQIKSKYGLDVSVIPGP